MRVAGGGGAMSRVGRVLGTVTGEVGCELGGRGGGGCDRRKWRL